MKRLLSHRGNATKAFASALGTAIAFGESIYTPDGEFVISPDTRSVWPIDPIECDVDNARVIYAEWSQGFMEACSMARGNYGVRLRLSAALGKVIVDMVRFP